jgi:hypothetical protein
MCEMPEVDGMSALSQAKTSFKVVNTRRSDQ